MTAISGDAGRTHFLLERPGASLLDGGPQEALDQDALTLRGQAAPPRPPAAGPLEHLPPVDGVQAAMDETRSPGVFENLLHPRNTPADALACF